MKKFLTKELLALYLIIAVGLFLRVQGIFTNSFAFTYDVGRDMLAVNDIVHLGKIPLIGQTTGLPGLFYGPWWYYILTVPFILSSGNPAGIVFFMALSGVASVFFGFKLGKNIGGTTLGLILASLLSFSPVMVGLASQIWNPNLIPLFVIIFMYCLHLIFVSLERKKNIGIMPLFFLGLMLGIILDSEVVFGSLFLVGAIISIFILVGKKLKLKDYLFAFLGFLLILLPRAIFDLRHKFLMTNTLLYFARNIFPSTHGNNSLFAPSNSIVSLFNLWLGTLSNGNWLLGIILIFFVIFSIIFYRKKLEKKEKSLLLFSLITIAVFLIGLSFFPGAIWDHYIVGVPVLYIFILSIAFLKVLQNFKLPVILIFIALLLFYVNPIRIINEWGKPLWEGDASVYRNQLAVADYVYKQANGKDFNYVLYTPPVHDYTYKYLFSWYGKNRYGYAPKIGKASLFFLIMEPDYQYPFRLTDWLKERKNDGKIVKEEVSKGNVTIQTRIH